MGSFINALKGWMGGQDWKTTNLQTRLGAVTGPILLPVSEYRITGGWLADLGSLKEKGQGDHKQLLKSRRTRA